jgi:hypothetical protein
MKRICAVPTHLFKGDAAYNVAIDLFLNEGGVPTKKMTAFGNFGTMANNMGETEPFLLHIDGTIDFGSSYDEDAVRFTKTTILNGRALVIGEDFNLTYEGRELTYRITRIEDLQ